MHATNKQFYDLAAAHTAIINDDARLRILIKFLINLNLFRSSSEAAKASEEEEGGTGKDVANV
jgi:hypothetical protein